MSSLTPHSDETTGQDLLDDTGLDQNLGLSPSELAKLDAMFGDWPMNDESMQLPEGFDNLDDFDFTHCSVTGNLLPEDILQPVPVVPQFDLPIQGVEFGNGLPEDIPPAVFTVPQFGLSPVPALGALVPNMTHGPLYHLSVGYYYPAVVLQSSKPQQNASIQRAEAIGPNWSNRINKRKTRSPEQDSKRAPPAPKRDRRRSLITKDCIVKVCTCNENSLNIPRPKNAFILYRSAHAKEVLAKYQGQHQKISQVLGQRWRNETDEVREKYQRLAAKEKREHARLYPSYRFQPRGRKHLQFGNTKCTCGAYRLNMKALQKKARLDSTIDWSKENPLEISDDAHSDLSNVESSLRRSPRERPEINYKD